jgi:sugar phosphate permease
MRVSAVAAWQKLHYAWIVAAVTFATLLVGAGIRSSPGILVVPLENEFHWSLATISFAISVNLLLYGLMGPFAAAMMNSFGIRRTMLAALASMCIGVAVTPLMRQSWQFVLLWGFLVGAGAGFTANVLAATVATRWFKAKRGVVVGLLASATAAGQLLFLPLLANIATSFGWRWMALTVASAALCLIPLVALFMRDRPEDIGLTAYGQLSGEEAAAPSKSNPVRAALSGLGVGLRSRDFWLLGGSFFVCGASTNGLIGTHLISACVDHDIPATTGAGLLASMAIFNLIGTTGSGWLSDRVDNRILLAVYYGLRGLSLLYLPYSFVSFYGLSLFAIFYGLDWLATVPPTVRLTAQTFGTENTGIMYGWLGAAHQLGGATAAFMAGILRMDLGSYLEAFVLSGLMCLVAALMVLFIGFDRKEPQQGAAAAALSA